MRQAGKSSLTDSMYHLPVLNAERVLGSHDLQGNQHTLRDANSPLLRRCDEHKFKQRNLSIPLGYHVDAREYMIGCGDALHPGFGSSHP